MDVEIQKLYNWYAPILDLSVTNKFVLRADVLAAYNALELKRQTLAAVDVYAKCYWQAEVLDDTFAHVFGEDVNQEFLENCRAADSGQKVMIYAIRSPEALARIGRYVLPPEDELRRRHEAQGYLAEHPGHRPSFYTAQDKIYIAVAGNEAGEITNYYLRNFVGPQYPLSYFCAFKPNCGGGLSGFLLDYVMFLREKGILKTV